MLTLHIDKRSLDRILKTQRISARTLSQNLYIMRSPTKGTVTAWLEGGVVAPRWRLALVAAFHADIFNGDGSLQRSVFEQHGITREALGMVTIRETITASAISEWRGGGGIEPDMLFALANYLHVAPLSLLANETCELLKRIIGVAVSLIVAAFLLSPAL